MPSTKAKTPRLGRGLSTLITAPPEVPVAAAGPAAAGAATPDATSDRIEYIPLSAIQPNPHQPRQHIDEAGLNRLADSIRNDGVMQPVILRPRSEAGAYDLVAGERRWRAAEHAGLDRIPAVIRDLTNQQLAEWALVENLQREDLNPIERAHAFQHLADQFNLSHDQIAQRVGIERSTVSNALRLLALSEEVQTLIARGLLSAGQARAIVGLVDTQQQLDLAKRAVRDALSVRQVEAAVRKAAQGQADPATGKTQQVNPRQAHLTDLADQISRQLGMKTAVRPARKKGAGAITIQFNSLEHFDQLLAKLGIETE